MKIKFSIATIAILFITCVELPAQNLVLNGGFETATIGLPGGTSNLSYPAVLDNWSAVNTDGEFLYDLTLPHTGTGFMSVLQNGNGNPQTPWLGAAYLFGNFDRAIQIVPVAPSTTYQFSCWIRSGNGLRYSGYGDGNVWIQIEEVSPSHLQIDTISFYTPSTWQNVTRTFTTGATCDSIAILFSGYSANDVDVWIDDVSITDLTDVDETASICASFSVFPNPIKNHLLIKNEKRLIDEIEITNVMGEKVLNAPEIKSNNAFMDVSDLATGIYFVKISAVDFSVVKKIAIYH